MTLGGKGNQPPPSHAWSGSPIADILQEACPKDWITKAVVLSPEEAILNYEICSCNEGFLYQKVKDIELGVRGSFNWARKPAQIEVTINTMQEGHQPIVDSVLEKKTKTRKPGCPQGIMKATGAPATTYNIEG